MSATFSMATYNPFGTFVTPGSTEKFECTSRVLVDAAGTTPGLYYIGARWVDPELGRSSFPQTVNRHIQ